MKPLSSFISSSLVFTCHYVDYNNNSMVPVPLGQLLITQNYIHKKDSDNIELEFMVSIGQP